MQTTKPIQYELIHGTIFDKSNYKKRVSEYRSAVYQGVGWTSDYGRLNLNAMKGIIVYEKRF